MILILIAFLSSICVVWLATKKPWLVGYLEEALPRHLFFLLLLIILLPVFLPSNDVWTTSYFSFLSYNLTLLQLVKTPQIFIT